MNYNILSLFSKIVGLGEWNNINVQNTKYQNVNFDILINELLVARFFKA